MQAERAGRVDSHLEAKMLTKTRLNNAHSKVLVEKIGM